MKILEIIPVVGLEHALLLYGIDRDIYKYNTIQN